MAFGRAVLGNDSVVVAANAGRNGYTDGHVGEEGAGKQLGWNRLAHGQVGRGKQGSDGEGRSRFELGYGAVENIFVGFLVGNFGLGGIGNLVATTGARRDVAVGEQQFAEVQANFFARPEDGVTNAIRKINFAGFGGAHQTGVAVIEVGEMPANCIVARHRSAEIVGSFNASGDHRVSVDAGRPREKPGGLGGSRGHQSKIFADVAAHPKRIGQDLGSMQGGQGEIAGRVLPARAGDERADDQSGQGSLNAQATTIPTSLSSHGLSGLTVVQNSTPTQQFGQWAAEGEQTV